MPSITGERLLFHDMKPKQSSFYEDTIKGLNCRPRSIPPKYFYDEHGSRLFDAICETPEYYPTRTEIAIIKDNIDEICECLGEDCILIEPGSGASKKVRVLLDALNPRIYMPLDISSDYLYAVARELVFEYSELRVIAACLDFTAPITLPGHSEHGRRIEAFFPGSSIGNFEPADALVFLNNIHNLVKKDGGLLIGVDLKKDSSIINKAYNDEQGITAQFNMNILARMNRELKANFDFDCFEHRAFYNEALGRLEMHLLCTNSQIVNIENNQFKFKKGESIHTENSYKYSVADFYSLAEEAGFNPQQTWTDKDELFSIHYLKA